MNIRDIRQNEAIEAWSDKGILFSAPRFGKIKTTFGICEKHNFEDILVVYPRNDIETGWKNDSILFDFKGKIQYSTYRSLNKINKQYDLIVFDEIHEASTKELSEVARLVKSNRSLGLTGTMTKTTEMDIFHTTEMSPYYIYSIDVAVREGILSDYEIYIHNVSLNDTDKYIKTKNQNVTEKKRFDQLQWVRNKLITNHKPIFFIDLKIISLIQNSIAKKEYTKKLLNKFQNDRVLVFCGVTNIADDLGINVYHSKNKDSVLFRNFCEGNGENHLAVIKMAESGITVKPIKYGIINYFSGSPESAAQKICRFLGLEYDNPNKKAEIHIICSDTSFEKERLTTALKFFDQSKIKTV